MEVEVVRVCSEGNAGRVLDGSLEFRPSFLSGTLASDFCPSGAVTKTAGEIFSALSGFGRTGLTPDKGCGFCERVEGSFADWSRCKAAASLGELHVGLAGRETAFGFAEFERAAILARTTGATAFSRLGQRTSNFPKRVPWSPESGPVVSAIPTF